MSSVSVELSMPARPDLAAIRERLGRLPAAVGRVVLTDNHRATARVSPLAAVAAVPTGSRIVRFARMTQHVSPTPEGLAFRESPVLGDHVRVVAVEYSPDQQHAVVFVEYNEPPDVERYELLRTRSGGGWRIRSGASAGRASPIGPDQPILRQSWAWTHDDARQRPLGVRTRWDPPSARWDVELPPP